MLSEKKNVWKITIVLAFVALLLAGIFENVPVYIFSGLLMSVGFQLNLRLFFLKKSTVPEAILGGFICTGVGFGMAFCILMLILMAEKIAY